MTRTLAICFVSPAALLACGGAGSGEAEQADFRKPGLYEITTQVGDLSRLALPPEQEAELRRLAAVPTQRVCLGATRPAVGSPFLDGRCRYTRVVDKGTTADRSVSCPADGATVNSFQLTGSTTVDGYRLRILSRRSDAATGRLLAEVETFEEGRRLGPCPK